MHGSKYACATNRSLIEWSLAVAILVLRALTLEQQLASVGGSARQELRLVAVLVNPSTCSILSNVDVLSLFTVSPGAYNTCMKVVELNE